MAKVFRSVKRPRLRRNPFNLGFENVLTTEVGRITPVLCQEVVPGDTFKISTEMLIRMAALYAPSFSRVNANVRYYFVPHRLGCKDFEVFLTGGEDGEGTITNRRGLSRVARRISLDVSAFRSYALDYFELEGLNPTQAMQKFSSYFCRRSLFDYLGFPSYDIDEEMSADVFAEYFTEPLDMAPFIAYQMVFNENYRDQNFQKEVDLCVDAHGDLFDYLVSEISDPYESARIVLELLTIRTANWSKDYYTSALPFPQRGEDTTIGENDTRVYGDGQYKARVLTDSQGQYADVDAQTLSTKFQVSGSIVASVNEFRRAMAIQRFKEALARSGARYTEFLRGIFGTSPADSKLQRPEFLGGGRVPIAFGEVLQTSETNITPQGTYAGRGIGGGRVPATKKKYFDEPGWIIGLLTIVPKPFYAQAWPRKFSRFDRLDFFIPQFANIGEQEILQKEVCFNYDNHVIDGEDTNNKIFGYIPRYSEMRWNPSEVHGDFRQTLLDWHTARILEPVTDPQRSMLNADFLKIDNNSFNRIFNYRGGDFDHFWIEIYNDVKAIRPLPKYGTPLF